MFCCCVCVFSGFFGFLCVFFVGFFVGVCCFLERIKGGVFLPIEEKCVCTSYL